MQLPQVKEERDLLLKKIYDYCVKVNWQKTKLDEMARELGTTRTNLRKLAKKYAKETLTAENYQKLIEQVDEIIDFEKTNSRTKLTQVNPILLELYNKETYYLWETKKEKELVLKYIYEYCIKANWEDNELKKLATKLNIPISKLKNIAKKYAKDTLSNKEYESLNKHINEIITSNLEIKKITLPQINPILEKLLGKKTYLLWENEEEKELVLKYIYNHCNEIKFSKEKVEQFSNWLGIHPYKISEFYKEYTLKYLKWTKEEYHIKRCEYLRNIKHIPETKKIYDGLLNAISVEEIIQIIASSKLEFQVIENDIKNYVTKYHNGKSEIKENLENKIKIYIDYTSNLILSNQVNTQEQIVVAITLVKLFVESKKSLTKDEFLQKKGINTKIFTNYLSLVMLNNFNLFNLYALKITDPNNVSRKKI